MRAKKGEVLKRAIVVLSMFLVILIAFLIIDYGRLTKDSNLDFVTQEVFTQNGYAEIESKISAKKEEYESYLGQNQKRTASYNKQEFKEALNKVEKDNDFEAMIEFINDNISNSEDANLFMEDFKVVINQELLNMNIKTYEMGENSQQAKSRKDYYYQLNNLQKLSYIIDVLEYKYNDFNNFGELKYSKGILSINEDKIPIGIIDTKQEKNLYKEEQKIKLNNYFNKVFGIVVSICIIIFIIAIIICLVKYKKILNGKIISLFILYFILSMICIGTYRMEVIDNYYSINDYINDAFGVSVIGNGNYYLDFKPMLVIEEFELRGGELPTQEDLSSAENYNKWLGDSEDETTNHTFDVLDENGKETGETYENTNKEVLDTIIAEIEDDEPNSSTNKFHPGFGGFGMNES